MFLDFSRGSVEVESIDKDLQYIMCCGNSSFHCVLFVFYLWSIVCVSKEHCALKQNSCCGFSPWNPQTTRLLDSAGAAQVFHIPLHCRVIQHCRVIPTPESLVDKKRTKKKTTLSGNTKSSFGLIRSALTCLRNGLSFNGLDMPTVHQWTGCGHQSLQVKWPHLTRWSDSATLLNLLFLSGPGLDLGQTGPWM